MFSIDNASSRTGMKQPHPCLPLTTATLICAAANIGLPSCTLRDIVTIGTAYLARDLSKLTLTTVLRGGAAAIYFGDGHHSAMGHGA
jgi:hypothetical protein